MCWLANGIQDYSSRSKNNNENKRRLKILRQKAAERNPDEFSHGMLSSQSRKGRKLADRQNPILSQDVVKLLKTQDAGYVATMLQRTKRIRARLEQEFVLCEDRDAGVLNASSDYKKESHKIFVNSEEEQIQYKLHGTVALEPDSMTRNPRKPSMNEEEHDPNGKSLVYVPEDVPKTLRAAERQKSALEQDRAFLKQRRKEQDARESKLAALNAREKDLIEAKNALDLQRAKMSNNVGGITKSGTKWKMRERKR